LGNIEESQWVNKISTNYIDFGESFNRKTTIVDINFSSNIASDLQPDLEPKIWQSASTDWIKWKEAIEAELCLLKKERYSHRLYLLLVTFSRGIKMGFCP
jgi:hypothetical protein